MEIRLRWFAVVGLALAAGCSDGIGPPIGAAPPSQGARATEDMHILRQSTEYAAVQPGQFGVSFETTASPKPLANYGASFWAVRGQDRVLEIRYLDGKEFFQLTVSAAALASYPDGTPFQAGDSVLITVQVDSSLFLIDLQPTGLAFNANTPAVLNLRYADANPDLNSDGVVDALDALIESTQLGLWVQETQGQPWFVNTADHLVTDKKFVGYLHHFSNYTVSW